MYVFEIDCGSDTQLQHKFFVMTIEKLKYDVLLLNNYTAVQRQTAVTAYFSSQQLLLDMLDSRSIHDRACIVVEILIYRRLQISRDDHLDQSKAYDTSYNLYENTDPDIDSVSFFLAE